MSKYNPNAIRLFIIDLNRESCGIIDCKLLKSNFPFHKFSIWINAMVCLIKKKFVVFTLSTRIYLFSFKYIELIWHFEEYINNGEYLIKDEH